MVDKQIELEKVMNTYRPSMLCALLIAVVLTACSRPSGETLDRAQASLESGAYREAMIDVKSVLQEEPNSARARWLLGRVYIAIEDGASAEKELGRARDFGVDDNSVVPLLAQALLMQNKSDEVLALTIVPPASSESTAELEASKGLAHLAKGEVATAEERIGNAMRLAPNITFVQLANAALLTEQGKTGESKAVLRSLIETNPGNGRAWSMLGRILFSEKAYQKAEEAYSQAMTHRVNFVGEQLQRGFSRLAQNDLDGAAQDVERLKEIAPDYPRVQYFAGRVAFHQGKFAEALEAFEKAYEQDGRHFQSVFLFATTNLLQGNKERALGLAEKAFAMYPRHIPTRKLLARLYLQSEKGVAAEQLLAPIVAAMPDDLDAKELLAASLMQQGRAGEATDLLEELAAKRPDDAKAQLRAGVGLMASDRVESGVDAMQRAIGLAPADRDVATAAVASLLRADKASDAMAISERLVQRSPRDPAAWNLLGHAQIAAGREAVARESFERVLELSPGDPAASSKLADLAMRDDDHIGAKRYLELSLRQNPDDPNLRYRLGLIMQAQGDMDAAREQLSQAVQSGSTPLAARVAFAKLLVDEGNPARALRILGDANQGQDISVVLTRADAYSALSRYVDARRALEAARSQAPNLPDLEMRLVRVYAQLGDREALAAVVDRMLIAQPDDARAKLVKVTLLAVDRDFSAAEAILQSLGLPDDDPAVLSARVFLEKSRGDAVKEASVARRLLAVQPSTANAIALASAEARAGKPEAAVGVLERWAAGRRTADVAALQALADLYAGGGRIENAKVIWEKIVEIDSDHVVALNNLAWYSRENDLTRALGYAEQAYRLAPEMPSVLDTYSDVLARAGKSDLAIRTIDAAVEKSGGQAALRLRRAEVFAMLGRRQEAVDETRTLLNEDPPQAVRERASALLSHWSKQGPSTPQ